MGMTLDQRRATADKRIASLTRQSTGATADGDYRLAAEADDEIARWDAWGNGLPMGDE